MPFHIAVNDYVKRPPNQKINSNIEEHHEQPVGPGIEIGYAYKSTINKIKQTQTWLGCQMKKAERIWPLSYRYDYANDR